MSIPQLNQFWEDVGACLRFYSRLNPPSTRGAAKLTDFANALRALPVAGAILGAFGAAALFCARALGVSAEPAAICAIVALMAVTGALHEDGLADLADGFGGGATREKKLEIMRDSRLGVFGAAALVLALMLRVSSLAALTERGVGVAIFALICAGAVSRAAGLSPLLLSKPARREGAGAAMPPPGREAVKLVLILCGAASLPLVSAGLSVAHALCADIAAALAAFAVTRLADRQIGGYTGDVLGAAQQAAEIAFLLALSAN